MVLLSKQPIFSPVVHGPTAEPPIWASTGRWGEERWKEKTQRSPHSRSSPNSLSFFTSKTPLASRDGRCPAAVLPTVLKSPRGRRAHGGGESAPLLATSPGNSPADVLPSPLTSPLLRLGLDVIRFKNRVSWFLILVKWLGWDASVEISWGGEEFCISCYLSCFTESHFLVNRWNIFGLLNILSSLLSTS